MNIVYNINDKVRVKLTDFGRSLISYPIEEDASGYSEWQLWCLMREFGEYMQMGFKLPIETQIEIPIQEYARGK